LQVLHAKGRIPEPAAGQGGIEDERLHKTVPGSPNHPLHVRFFRIAGGIRSGIDQDGLFFPVDQQGQRTGQDRRHHFVDLLCGFHFEIGHMGADQPVDRPGDEILPFQLG